MSYLLGAFLFAGLLVPKGLHEFSFLKWLPYSSVEFFAVFIPVAILVSVGRRWLKSERQWWAALLILNLAYLLFFFSQPLQVAFFTFYSFAILRWRRHKPKQLPWQMLFLLLPMILRHNTHELQFWGISYATFRAFHLLMDDEQLKELSFRRYFIFLFYFPSLLAGPIDRWPRFKKAVAEAWKTPITECVPLGLQWMVFGIVQKFVLAEALQRWFLPTSASLHGWTAWLKAFYGFPLYLYLDFAGYSAMAIGFSLLMGISLPLNFDQPYLAQNPQEFWRRFHISLGEWLRDYFFKPLYRLLSTQPRFKPHPLLRQNIAIFATFFLMGVWNGTETHFIASGSLFGLYSVIHNCFGWWAKRRGFQLKSSLWIWTSRLIMVHAACLSLLIFCANMWR